MTTTDMPAVCPVPVNETARLQAVHMYRILDTQPELQFDATARVAAHLLEAPIAVIALLDRDRLWFKARIGLDIPELDRKIAFCAHTIMRPSDLMVVEDLSADARFSDNPLVVEEPRLRFYAGMPLLDSSGFALGTIAVLDTLPRRLDARQCNAFRDLAVSVMTALQGHRRAQELERLATTDYLTGAANRVHFETALAAELQQAQHSGVPLALLCLDLDGFKDINDRLGHAAGDEVLREVSRRLHDQVRGDDLVARLGGDEFAVLMRGGADVCAARVLAERVIAALRQPMTVRDGDVVRIGASVGVALCPEHGHEASALIDCADQALYRAKQQTVRRWAVYDDDRVSLLADDGRPAHAPTPLLNGDTAHDTRSRLCQRCVQGRTQPFAFSMAFQPIVDMRRRRVYAYEALVRGPAGEPARTVLERVTPRNRYTFDQSCRTTAIHLAAGLGLVERGASLAINFIASAMYEPQNCIRGTLRAAEAVGLPKERLIFEVGEGEDVRDRDALIEIFRVYREHGLRPAIDDFGAGYAGLKLLSEFQPALVKLDRELTREIDRHAARRAVVQGMMMVCAALNIEVVAESVETAAEYQTLAELGVHLFQGYLFARPAFEALPEPIFP